VYAWVFAIGGVCSWLKLVNTPTIPLSGYPINTLGSITYLLKLGRVFHNPSKTYKQSNTLLGVFNKQHGLNYFGLDYQRVLLMARSIQCTCNTACRASQKSFGFYNICFETYRGITLPYQNIKGKQCSHHIAIIP